MLQTLLDYLRISVLVILTYSFDKKDFIDLIDKAMLEKGSDERLQDGLKDTRAILECVKDEQPG